MYKYTFWTNSSPFVNMLKRNNQEYGDIDFKNIY